MFENIVFFLPKTTFFISAVNNLSFSCAKTTLYFYFTSKILCVDNLKNGKFHQHLRDIFAPQVFESKTLHKYMYTVQPQR